MVRNLWGLMWWKTVPGWMRGIRHDTWAGRIHAGMGPT